MLYPLSFLTLVVFTTALTFWVSALNVRYRDVQHLIGLALLVWFWMTPIVYPGGHRPGQADRAHGAVVAAPVDGLPAEPAHADRLGVPASAVRHGVAGRHPRAARREHRLARRRHRRRARRHRSCCSSTRGACSSGSPATSRRSCDRRARDRGRLQGLPPVPRTSELAQAARALRAHARRGLLGAPRHRVRGPGGLVARVDRPQRLGQDHAAEVHRRDPASDVRRDPLSRPGRGAARAGRRLPPRADRPRERLPERVVPRSVAQGHRPRVRRHRRVRRAAGLHGQPGEVLLVGDARAARLRGGRARRARHPADRRGARRRRRGVPGRSASTASGASRRKGGRSSS